MNKTFLLLLTTGVLEAAIQNVSVTEFSATQAILKYQAPDSAACTVKVSENANLQPLVDDVDPVKFPGSNSDLRPGNVQAGNERSFVIGKRAAPVGASGIRYSRALQAETTHYFSITCPGPGNVVSGTFRTLTILFGNTYAEAQPGDVNKPGELAQPHISLHSRTDRFIDPQTGMLTTKLTTAQDSFVDIDGYPFTVIRAASAWQGSSSANAAVALSKASDGLFASISGSTAPLFLGVVPNTVPYGDNINMYAWAYSGQHAAFSYYQPHVVAAVNRGGTLPSDPEDRKIQICPTIDNVKCWAAWRDVPVTTSLSDVSTGSKSPGDLLQATGGASPSWIEQAAHGGTVSCDGSATVTWTGGNLFAPHWTTGTIINIAGVDYPIDTVTDTQKLTLGSACPASASASFFASSYGVLLRKKTASSDTISIDYAYLNYELGFFDVFTNGQAKLCSDITVPGPSGSYGYNCHIPGHDNHFWVDAETGEAHLFNTTGNYGCNGENNVFDSKNPDKVWCVNVRSQLESITYYGDHSEPLGIWPNGGIRRDQGLPYCNTGGGNAPPYRGQQPCVVHADPSPGTDIQTLTAAFTSNPAYAPAYDSAGFHDISFRDIDTEGRIMFSLRRTGAGTAFPLAWLMEFDPNATSNSEGGTISGPLNNHGCIGGGLPGCVVAAMPSWARPGCRWCPYKEGSYADTGWLYATTYGWQDARGGGPYKVRVVDGTPNGTLDYLGGPTTFVNCPSNWRGITGQKCSKITVGSEPFSPNHGPPETGLPGEMGDVRVGDYFSPPNSSNGFSLYIDPYTEQMELLAKEPGAVPGTWVYTLLRAINYYGQNFNSTINGPFAITTAKPDLFTVCNSKRTPKIIAGGGIFLWDFLNDPHGMNTDGRSILNSPVDYVGHAFWDRGNWASIEIPSYDPRCYLQQCYATLVKKPSENFYQVATKASATAQISALPLWSLGAGVVDGSQLQSHGTNGGSLADPERTGFLFDGRPYRGGQSSGSIGGSGDCPATRVAGQLWKFTAACLPTLERPFRKIYPTGAFSGSFPLIDVSGPASVITSDSASEYRYCQASVAGECVSGSDLGDLYVNAPHVRYPFCFQADQVGNLPDEQDLCISGSPSVRDAIVQVGMNDTDLIGKTTRVLSKFTAPRRMSPFWTPYVLPNGKWMMFEAQMTGDKTANKAIMLGKIPSPVLDSTSASTFVPITLKIPAHPGQSAYVRFGYAENGDPGSFFCTSRNESCVSTKQDGLGGNVANPFFYEQTESSSYTPVNCNEACSIIIPGVPERVMYFQVVYTGGAQPQSTTPVMVTMVP